MKKALFMVVVALFASLAQQAEARSRQYDLIIAPARFSVIQVLFDVAANRPSVLVSYQGEATTAEPLLHVWNGTAWDPITLHDLREISFVQKTPTRAILVGGDDLLPATVRESVAWMPEVVYIRDLSNAALLNEFGRLQSWTRREWSWFATRYNLNLEDEAAPMRARSWYDQPASSLRRNEADVPSAPITIPVEPGSVRQPMMPPANLPLQSEVVRPSDVPAPAQVPVTEPLPVAVTEPAEPVSEVVVVVDPSAEPVAETVSPVEAPVK